MNVPKFLTPQYLLGLGVSLAVAYATFTAWQAGANASIERLNERAAISQADHDTLIGLQADVRSIKESVARIERLFLYNKEASASGK